MTNVSRDGWNFSGLAWIPSKHTETSIWSHRVIKVGIDLVKNMWIKVPYWIGSRCDPLEGHISNIRVLVSVAMELFMQLGKWPKKNFNLTGQGFHFKGWNWSLVAYALQKQILLLYLKARKALVLVSISCWYCRSSSRPGNCCNSLKFCRMISYKRVRSCGRVLRPSPPPCL